MTPPRSEAELAARYNLAGDLSVAAQGLLRYTPGELIAPWFESVRDYLLLRFAEACHPAELPQEEAAALVALAEQHPVLLADLALAAAPAVTYLWPLLADFGLDARAKYGYQKTVDTGPFGEDYEVSYSSPASLVALLDYADGRQPQYDGDLEATLSQVGTRMANGVHLLVPLFAWSRGFERDDSYTEIMGNPQSWALGRILDCTSATLTPGSQVTLALAQQVQAYLEDKNGILSLTETLQFVTQADAVLAAAYLQDNPRLATLSRFLDTGGDPRLLLAIDAAPAYWPLTHGYALGGPMREDTRVLLARVPGAVDLLLDQLSPTELDPARFAAPDQVTLATAKQRQAMDAMLADAPASPVVRKRALAL